MTTFTYCGGHAPPVAAACAVPRDLHLCGGALPRVQSVASSPPELRQQRQQHTVVPPQPLPPLLPPQLEPVHRLIRRNCGAAYDRRQRQQQPPPSVTALKRQS